jgi:peptide-methionine (S)-S-oxide reductase
VHDRPYHERIEDPVFRRAVDLIDSGDVEGVRAHLTKHPGLIHQRVSFEPGYFANPALLEFVAENPIRHERLPSNIVDVARTILDAGARADSRALNGTLMLVASGRVPRECRVQVPLIDLLCDYGADANSAMRDAIAHGEWSAVDALIRRGADVDMAAAAAMGRVEDVRRALPAAGADLRHFALAWAAQYGHTDVVRLLLDAGEDPDRHNPPGAHAHSTPLHQAALAGHLPVVRLLVDRGARRDIRDTIHDGTALQWAEYAGRADVVEFLRASSPDSAGR